MNYKDVRRRRKEGTENLFEEIIPDNFPKLEKKIDSSRGIESTKQEEPKEIHAKT